MKAGSLRLRMKLLPVLTLSTHTANMFPLNIQVPQPSLARLTGCHLFRGIGVEPNFVLVFCILFYNFEGFISFHRLSDDILLSVYVYYDVYVGLVMLVYVIFENYIHIYENNVNSGGIWWSVRTRS